MKILNFLKFVLVFTILCFSVSGFADSTRDQQLAEIACRYQMKVIPHDKFKLSSTNDWFFLRKPGLVQTQDASGEHGELWERTATGNIQYRKLYHADKTAIEYMPSDMSTNSMNFDWAKLSTMLSQQELDTLRLIKKKQMFGHNAELRRGKIGDQTVEVTYLSDLNLPAIIIKQDKTGRMELRLAEISPLATASWRPISLEEIANYRHIDAVDFGDMENDPFVKKVMAVDSHHH